MDAVKRVLVERGLCESPNACGRREMAFFGGDGVTLGPYHAGGVQFGPYRAGGVDITFYNVASKDVARQRAGSRLIHAGVSRAALAAAGRKTSTGTDAAASTCRVWLPAISLARPRRPCEPMTTRSQPSRTTASSIASAGT